MQTHFHPLINIFIQKRIPLTTTNIIRWVKWRTTYKCPKLQVSNKSKCASSSSNEEVYQISQSSLRKKRDKQIITSQSPKLQLSKKSKDASSSSKEEESLLKKSVKKKFFISKSSKLQASNKSKDASLSSNEVYSISESPLRRKANK